MFSSPTPAIEKLHQAFGPKLVGCVLDQRLSEIMLNSDGRIFTENTDGKMSSCGYMDEDHARMAILTLASLSQGVFDPKIPIISCELPFGNARFEGLLPPLSNKPVFSIRRHGFSAQSLADLVECGMITSSQCQLLQNILKEHRSLIVCGETGCGKTTLLQALLSELKTIFPQERIITIEDTPELKCALENTVALYSGTGCPLGRLVCSSLRLRPDRIVMGEIRGPEALDLIDALTTGHAGSMATMHAGSPKQALRRLTLLVSRHPQSPRLIEPTVAQAVDLIALLSARPQRHLESITLVQGFSQGEFLCQEYSPNTTPFNS